MESHLVHPDEPILCIGPSNFGYNRALTKNIACDTRLKPYVLAQGCPAADRIYYDHDGLGISAIVSRPRIAALLAHDTSVCF